VEEVDHVDEDLHDADRHHGGGCDARVGDHVAHHQPERHRGEDDRKEKARQVAPEGPMPGLVMVVQDLDVDVGAVETGAHGNTLTR